MYDRCSLSTIDVLVCFVVFIVSSLAVRVSNGQEVCIRCTDLVLAANSNYVMPPLPQGLSRIRQSDRLSFSAFELKKK